MSTVATLTRWFRGWTNKPQDERRREPRTPFAGSIEVRTAGGTTFRGVARDLSDGGMGAIVYADLSVGDRVVIYYIHPLERASRFVFRTACVRGRHGSRYGFEFENAEQA
ncbi:MAG: PilZ domain-containing protein [Mycobacteriales bacterium]